MNKPRIILAAVCILAAAGGALASKAKFAELWIKGANNVYTTVQADPCPPGAADCTTRTFNAIYTLYAPDGAGGYVTLKRQP